MIPKHAHSFDLGRELCEALDLDPHKTKSLDIRMDAGEFIDVRVEQEAYVIELKQIVAVISDYRLCKGCEKCDEAAKGWGG